MPITADKILWAYGHQDGDGNTLTELANWGTRPTVAGTPTADTSPFGRVNGGRELSGTDGYLLGAGQPLPGAGGWLSLAITTNGTANGTYGWCLGSRYCRIDVATVGVRFQCRNAADTGWTAATCSTGSWNYNSPGDHASAILSGRVNAPGSGGTVESYVHSIDGATQLASASSSFGTNTLIQTAENYYLGDNPSQLRSAPMKVDGAIAFSDPSITKEEIAAGWARCHAAGFFHPGFFLTDAVASIDDYSDETLTQAHRWCVECGRVGAQTAPVVKRQDLTADLWVQPQVLKTHTTVSAFTRNAKNLLSVLAMSATTETGPRIRGLVVATGQEVDLTGSNAAGPDGNPISFGNSASIGTLYSQNVSFVADTLTVTLGALQPRTLKIDSTAAMNDGRTLRLVDDGSGGVILVGTSVSSAGADVGATTEVTVSSGTVNYTTGEVNVTLSGTPSVLSMSVRGRAPGTPDPEAYAEMVFNAWMRLREHQRSHGVKAQDVLLLTISGPQSSEVTSNTSGANDPRRGEPARNGWGFNPGRNYADVVSTTTYILGQGWYCDETGLDTFAGHSTTFWTKLKELIDDELPGQNIPIRLIGDSEFTSLITRFGLSVTPTVFSDVLAHARAGTEKVDGLRTWKQIYAGLPGPAVEYITSNGSSGSSFLFNECLRSVDIEILMYRVYRMFVGPALAVLGERFSASEYDTEGAYGGGGSFGRSRSTTYGVFRARAPIVRPSAIEFAPLMYGASPTVGMDLSAAASEMGWGYTGELGTDTLRYIDRVWLSRMEAASAGGQRFGAWFTNVDISTGAYEAQGVPANSRLTKLINTARLSGLMSLVVYLNVSSTGVDSRARDWVPLFRSLGMLRGRPTRATTSQVARRTVVGRDGRR